MRIPPPARSRITVAQQFLRQLFRAFHGSNPQIHTTRSFTDGFAQPSHAGGESNSQHSKGNPEPQVTEAETGTRRHWLDGRGLGSDRGGRVPPRGGLPFPFLFF